MGGLVIFYLWYKNPKNVEIILSQIMRLFTFVGSSPKKWQIKFSLQGTIGRNFRDLEAHTGVHAPYGLSIRWVAEGAERRSFLRGDTVIARMSYDDNPHLNYITAALLYMRQGLIPHGRGFLVAPIRRAMDLATLNLILERAGNRAAQNTFADEILPAEFEAEDDIRKHFKVFMDIEDFGLFGRVFLPEIVEYRAAQNTFADEILPAEFEAEDDIRKHFKVFMDIEDFGLFGRVFLPEIVEYGIREHEGGPRARHREELSRFIAWLSALASDTEYKAQRQLEFMDQSLKVHVVPVGIWEKIVEKGIEPWVTTVTYCRNNGVRTVYLMARGRSTKSIPDICDRVQQMGLCRVEDTYHFRSRLPGESRRIEATICRLSIIN